MTQRTPALGPASLKDYAASGNLPAHQAMDRETITWIAAHRPALGARPLSLPGQPVLLMPRACWFAEPQLADTIHGVGHAGRVCLLAWLLAREHRLSRADTAALCTAAAVHDCRRRDDYADAGHGQRSARWFELNRTAVTAALSDRLTPLAAAKAAAAVAVHDIPYTAFTLASSRTYQQAPLLADLLKGADCLDRYRLPLQRWWPRPGHLRVTIPGWLHAVAFDLVVLSERARLSGATYHDAVPGAWHALATGKQARHGC